MSYLIKATQNNTESSDSGSVSSSQGNSPDLPKKITPTSVARISCYPQPLENSRFPQVKAFVEDAYAGKYGVNSTRIVEELNRHPAQLNDIVNCFNYNDPDILQLKFLFICLDQEHYRLQDTCRHAHCRLIGLSQPHIIIDHLKELFFLWVQRKYTPLGLSDLTLETNEYMKMCRLFPFLLDKHLHQNIPLRSMLATLFPFISVKKEHLAYDILGRENYLYRELHKIEPHPYIRLGGDLHWTCFSLDCRNFDMRGVDLHGSCCYHSQYHFVCREFSTPSDERLLQYHANFAGTDLRGANLNNTQFHVKAALENTKLDGASLIGSNIPALQKDQVSIFSNRNSKKTCNIM